MLFRSSVLKPFSFVYLLYQLLTEGNYNFLKIELDKVNGIDLDTIVAATEVINPIIDKLDLIDDSYILDITSKEKGDE